MRYSAETSSSDNSGGRRLSLASAMRSVGRPVDHAGIGFDDLPTRFAPLDDRGMINWDAPRQVSEQLTGVDKGAMAGEAPAALVPLARQQEVVENGQGRVA